MHVTLVHPHIVCFLNLLEKKSTSKQMKLCTQRRVLLWLHCIEAWNAKSWRIPIIRFCIGGSIHWWMDQTQTDGWDCTTATVAPLCQGMLTPKFTKAYLMFYAVKSKEMQGLILATEPKKYLVYERTQCTDQETPLIFSSTCHSLLAQLSQT